MNSLKLQLGEVHAQEALEGAHCAHMNSFAGREYPRESEICLRMMESVRVGETRQGVGVSSDLCRSPRMARGRGRGDSDVLGRQSNQMVKENRVEEWCFCFLVVF